MTGTTVATAHRSVWQDLATTEFRQGFVEADGLRTRYVQAGPPTAAPVVMLHGTGGHWETFSRNLSRLSESLCCYAVDMLGCGFTDKPDRPYEVADYARHALAFCDVMGIERASFVGVSLGSWVTCRIALDAPQRVERIILNSPAGLLPLSPVAARAAARRRQAAVNPSRAAVVEILEHLFHDPRTLTDDLVALRQRVYGLPEMAQLGGRMLTLFDPEIRRRNLLTDDEWRAIAAPTLVFAHVDAPDDYLETARRIAALIPDVTTVEIRGAGHWPHFEQPDVFNEAALGFLSGGGHRGA